MENKDQNIWLIRDVSNTIRGPFKHLEVLNLIKKKQLKNKTELARANSYWFAVEEKIELARFFPELGLEAPPEEERQTQMTATLTHSDPEPEEATKFLATPTAKNLPEEKVSGAEWLNQEMAEEFGDFGDISLVTDTSAMAPPSSEPTPDEMPTFDGKAADEMLKRATVKADTLPSELKDFQGSRPKPINTLMRGPERAPGAGPSMVQVPIEKNESHPNILSIENEEAAVAKRRRHFNTTIGIMAFMITGFLGYIWFSKNHAAVKPKAAATAIKQSNLTPEEALKRSLALYDLQGAKEAISSMESASTEKEKVFLGVAQALVKREFLFDSEGALNNLQQVRAMVTDVRTKNEVENLFAMYAFDRDPEAAAEILRKLIAAEPNVPMYKYNLAIALLRSNKGEEAMTIIAPLANSLREEDPLFADASFALGWAYELDPKSRDTAEGAFLRAIAADPSSAKSRLGLAIHRLRRIGFRGSETDFRAFVDSAPELDPPARIINYRKMQAPEFYNSARSWIRELNLDGPMGSKPSPLIMAVDAILSCLQNRTGEAGKILEGAMSSANGDFSVLKAMGYHRWKEGRYAEIVELFRDVPKDKMGFSVPFIMGKAYVKLDRSPLAQKMFESLTVSSPGRSEGWALLGERLLESGKKADAQTKLTNALRKDPFDLTAVRALDRMGQQEVFSDEIMENLPF